MSFTSPQIEETYVVPATPNDPPNFTFPIPFPIIDGFSASVKIQALDSADKEVQPPPFTVVISGNTKNVVIAGNRMTGIAQIRVYRLTAPGQPVVFPFEQVTRIQARQAVDLIAMQIIELEDRVIADVPGSVMEHHITDGHVTTDKIDDLAVTTEKIAMDAVTTAKIDDMAVITPKLNDAAVTSAKIAPDAVGTTQISDDAVTDSKLSGTVRTSIDDKLIAASMEMKDRMLEFVSGAGVEGDVTIPGISVQDEDTLLGGGNDITQLNFKGAGVVATVSGAKVDIEIRGSDLDLVALEAFQTETETLQTTKKVGVTELFSVNQHWTRAVTGEAFNPEQTVPTLDHASAFFRITVTVPDQAPPPYATHTFAAADLPENDGSGAYNAQNSISFPSRNPAQIFYLAKNSSNQFRLVVPLRNVQLIVKMEKIEVSLPWAWAERGNINDLIPGSKIPILTPNHLPDSTKLQIRDLIQHQNSLVDSVFEHGLLLLNRAVHVNQSAGSPTTTNPIYVEINQFRYVASVKILKSTLSKRFVKYLRDTPHGALIGFAVFATDRTDERDSVWYNEIANVQDSVSASYTDGFFTINLITLPVTQRDFLPGGAPYNNTGTVDAIEFSHVEDKVAEFAVDGALVNDDVGHVQAVLDAFDGGGWADAAGAGDLGTTHPYVGEHPRATQWTTTNIQTETYGQLFQRGPRVSSGYVAIRIPVVYTTPLSRLRLRIGFDTESDENHVDREVEQWVDMTDSRVTLIFSNTTYNYYSAGTFNFPTGVRYQIQFFTPFTLDDNKVTIPTPTLVKSDWDQNDETNDAFIRNKPDVGTPNLTLLDYIPYDIVGDFADDGEFQVTHTFSNSNPVSTEIKKTDFAPGTSARSSWAGIIPSEGLTTITGSQGTISAFPANTFHRKFRLSVGAQVVNGILGYTSNSIFLLTDYAGLGDLEMYRGLDGAGVEMTRTQNNAGVTGVALNGQADQHLRITEWSLGTPIVPYAATENLRIVSSNDDFIMRLSSEIERGLPLARTDFDDIRNLVVAGNHIARMIFFQGTESVFAVTGPQGSTVDSHQVEPLSNRRILFQYNGDPVQGFICLSPLNDLNIYAAHPDLTLTTGISVFINGVKVSSLINFALDTTARWNFSGVAGEEKMVLRALVPGGNTLPATGNIGIVFEDNNQTLMELVTNKEDNDFIRERDYMVVQKNKLESNDTKALALRDIIPRIDESDLAYMALLGDFKDGIALSTNAMQVGTAWHSGTRFLLGSENMETTGNSAAREVTITTSRLLRVTKGGNPVLALLFAHFESNIHSIQLYYNGSLGSLSLSVNGVTATRTFNNDSAPWWYANGSVPSNARRSIWQPAELTAIDQTIVISSSDPDVSIQLIENRSARAPRGLPVREGLIIDDVQKGLLRGRSGAWVPFASREVKTNIYENSGGRVISAGEHFFAVGNDLDLSKAKKINIQIGTSTNRSLAGNVSVTYDEMVPEFQKLFLFGGSVKRILVSYDLSSRRIRIHSTFSSFYVFSIDYVVDRFGFFT